jgi:hypothetical protein
MNRFKSGVLPLVWLLSGGLCAQTKAPTVKISVDASEAPRKIFHAQLTIPASPGTLTLY